MLLLLSPNHVCFDCDRTFIDKYTSYLSNLWFIHSALAAHLKMLLASYKNQPYNVPYLIFIDFVGAVAQCTCMHLLFTCFSVLQEDSQSSSRALIGNDTFIQNNWNHKTVGTEETFHKGTAFRVTRNDWTEVKHIVTSLNVLLWTGDATHLLLMSNYKPSSMWEGTLEHKRSS